MNETAAPGIAVLRARLPYVDRRSLSEAWFSALHLAADEASAVRPRTDAPAADARAPMAPHPAAPLARREPRGTAAPATAARRSAAIVPRDARVAGELLERARRAPHVATVRRVCAPQAAHLARGASLTVGVDGSRVQLVLRREGDVLHVVALCRPDLAQRVGRALAHAGSCLRGDDFTVRAAVRTCEGPVGA